MDAILETGEDVEKSHFAPKKGSWYGRLSSSVVWVKVFRWEFWPFSVFYFPVFFYWMYLSIRSRSFFFFTSSNPTIEFGGMLGESKMKIFDLIPDVYIPKTYRLNAESRLEEVKELLKDAGLDYPVILKPDIGERGWMVELVKSEAQLVEYLQEIRVDFLVQEYVSYSVELGVFYYRYPDRSNGTVSSVVMKEMLSVIGDGTRTVAQLMEEDPRAQMHISRLQIKEPRRMKEIPERGVRVELVSIGNHCLGTTFINANHLINDKLIRVFDQVSQQIDGFYFGRYDLRCRSIEDLYQGEHFKILELNGAGAEPAHIYHPGFSLIQAYKDIIHHLGALADISRINRRRGYPHMSFRKGLAEIAKIRKYNREKEKKT